ncbi:hypothetical protein, partial [Escherichia coli]|uniref:hypothetical protein n=1 Tax=Escherichia coli TaxID=562 RepID=UPI00273DBD06
RFYVKNPPQSLPTFHRFHQKRLERSTFNQSHSMANDTALPGLILRDLRHKKPGISFTETAQMRIMTTTAKDDC